MIAIIFLLAMIGTHLILRGVPTQYKSVAEISLVSPKHQNEAGLPRSAFDFDAARVSTEIALLESKSLALRVVEELNLDSNPEFQQRHLASRIFHTRTLPRLWQLLGLSYQERPDETAPAKDASAQPSSALDEAADDLRERLKVDRLGLSYVLAISMTTQDAALSQRIVDAVARNFFAEEREARADARQRASSWLRNWISELRASLSETEGAIEKLTAESGLSDTGFAVNVTEQRMSKLQSAADAKRKLLEQALDDLNQLSSREPAGNEGGHVIAPASVPHPPSALHKALLLGTAVALAVGLGLLRY